MKYLFLFSFILAILCVINCADSLGAEHPAKDYSETINQAKLHLRSKRGKSGGGAEIGRNVGENIGRMTEDISDSLKPALEGILKSASDGTKGIGDSLKSLKPGTSHGSKKGSDDPVKSSRPKSSSQN